jgi:hypothetical protein
MLERDGKIEVCGEPAERIGSFLNIKLRSGAFAASIIQTLCIHAGGNCIAARLFVPESILFCALNLAGAGLSLHALIYEQAPFINEKQKR